MPTLKQSALVQDGVPLLNHVAQIHLLVSAEKMEIESD
jgi:hypothetical protein